MSKPESVEEGSTAGQLTPETIVRRLAVQLSSNLDQQTKTITDTDKLRSLKNLVRRDDELMEPLIVGIYAALKSNDIETRLGAVVLSDHFFKRSGKFRELLIEDFQGAKETANELKITTLKTVKQWFEQYGEGYKKLQLAYRFLKGCKSLDFERLDAQTEVERRRTEEERERKDGIRRRLLDITTQRLDDLVPEISLCTTEMENALNLLYPSFTESNSTPTKLRGESSKGGDTFPKCRLLPSEMTQLRPQDTLKDSDDLSAHGFGGGLEIRIDNVDKPLIELSPDNQALIQSLRDNNRLVKVTYLPRITKWLSNLSRIGDCDQMTKRLIDLKVDLESWSKMFSDLNLTLPSVPDDMSKDTEVVVNGGTDSDEDLEEVPEKEGLELDTPLHNTLDILPSHILKHTTQKGTKNMHNDKLNTDSKPCSSHSVSVSAEGRDSRESTPTGISKSASVPTLSFGLDLKYWGREKEMEPPSIVKNNADSHRFWRPSEGQTDSAAIQSESVAYRTRVMTFVGDFKARERVCRAPLASSNGKLCKRSDATRCPLHGPIIDRDVNGVPATRANRHKLSDIPSTSARPPDWQDEDLLRDIEDQTGKNLRVIKKKKGGKYKNRKTPVESSRDRLEKKLFDKKALKRVGETLDAIQEAKNKRKYEHQFNYVLHK